MRKKTKIQEQDPIEPKQPETAKKASKIADFIKINKDGIALCAALFTLVISFLAMIKDNFFMLLQHDIFRALKLPYEQMFLLGHKVSFPPFFIYDLCLAVVSIIFIYIMISAKMKGRPLGLLKMLRVLVYFVIIAVLYCMQASMYLAEKAYLLQGIIWLVIVAMMGYYFYRADRDKGIAIIESGLLEPGERRNLFIFTAVMAVVYLWDFGSWKYAFIGDEYAFYDGALGVANGSIPLRFFYETGVYGDHPVLASIYPGVLMKIFGTGLFGWKINSAIIPPLTIIPLYLWAKLVFNKRVAMITAVAFAFSAAMLAFSHIAHDVIHPVLPFVVSLLFIELAMRKNSSFWSFAAGVVLALGCYTF